MRRNQISSFGRLMAAEVRRYPLSSFPFTFSPMSRRVPSHTNRTIPVGDMEPHEKHILRF
jgi:hypothetical protein